MLPESFIEKFFFESKFKKEPIEIKKELCYNCKNNYTYQKTDFFNQLLFFRYFDKCDYSTPECWQNIIENLKPTYTLCNYSSSEWSQNIIENLKPTYTYCNTSSGLWCNNIIKGLKSNCTYTYCNTSSGLWCNNIIKGL